MIKRTLKFTLCGALLAVGMSANAQVLLKGVTDPNKAITWQEFVEVLNGKTPTITVDQTLITNLNNAKEAYYGVNGSFDDPKNFKEATETQLAVPSARLDSIQKAQATETALSDYDTADKNVDKWTRQLSTLPSDKVAPVWLANSKTNADNFLIAFNQADFGYEYDENLNIYYQIKKALTKDQYSITLSFINPGVTISDGVGNGVDNSTNWYAANAVQFINIITNKTITVVNVFFGKDKDGNNNYTGSNTGYVPITIDSTNGILGSAVNKVDNLYSGGTLNYDPNAATRKKLTDDINAYTTNDPKWGGITQLEYLYDLYQQAKSQSDTAAKTATAKLQALTAAEKAYNDAVSAAGTEALENYNEVTLSGPVTATTAITKSFNGHINGNGNVITIPANITSLFGTNFKNGSLENAIINGYFATGTSANNYSNVAVWRGANGVYYDTDNGTSGTIDNIGKLAFNYRDDRFFAADIAKNELVKWSTDYRVFNITIYEPEATTQCYSNLSNGQFVNATKTIGDNTFVWSATNDFGEIANVFVGSGPGSYTCKKVKIKDQKDFYSPFDITAESVEYVRNFTAQSNSVCMPFEFSVDNLTNAPENTAICTYDKETPGKNGGYTFWFKRYTKVAANKPALIVFPETPSTPVSLSLSKITIKQTTDQMPVDEGLANGSSKCYGLFVSANATNFDGGAEHPEQVYVLQGGKFNYLSNISTTIPAFRSVVWTSTGTVSGEGAAPRSIRLVDQRGVDVTGEYFGETSGVENVAEAAALSIVGGQGEIFISSDADYGKVEVYNVNGGLVTVADVVEGNTSIKVEKGIYIVMGKKVMVK